MSARSVTAVASPSLALVKYWGKSDAKRNTPATSSVAVTLSGLESRTTVTPTPPDSEEDVVYIDGAQQPAERFSRFFENVRRVIESDLHFDAKSTNNFPTAAGIASSASGFAALTVASARCAGVDLPPENLSAIARVGSASAARSIFGGFTHLAADAEQATTLFPCEHWPAFRIVVVAITTSGKGVSSRDAMERSRRTSPYYQSWLEDAKLRSEEARTAIEKRDIERLGTIMRLSYLRMFSTMFSCDPPIIYWHPTSLSLIHLCETLRGEGIGAWETMDAGPQVKIACLESDTEVIIRRIEELRPECRMYVCAPGTGASIIETDEW